MKLKPHRICGKRPARQPRPFDRAFGFLDPLLARPALVVEGNLALGGAALVRHDEADARITTLPSLSSYPAMPGAGAA